MHYERVVICTRTTIGLHPEQVVVCISPSTRLHSTAPLLPAVLPAERANFDSQLGGQDIIHNT